MYRWNWCFNVFHSPSVVIWPALRTSKCRCSKFYTAIYGDGSKPWCLVNPKIGGKWMFIPLKCIYRYWPICVCHITWIHVMHNIRFQLCIWSLPQHPSAPVVPRASLPTSRWPGVFGTPKTHGLPSVSDGFLLLLKWLAMSEGNCLCSGFCLIYYQFPPL